MAYKIVLLAGKGNSSPIVYNELAKNFGSIQVILENKPSKFRLFKNRIKKIGYIRAFDQFLFILIVQKLLATFSKRRIANIIYTHNLDTSPIPNSAISHVNSINDEHSLDLLKSLNPDVIVVNGTRILSKSLLKSCNSFFINTHLGITPKYRGVHGGYWSILNKDLENFGATVHLVDSGIDTGSILYQTKFVPSKSDNFVTYPYMQLAKALPFLVQSIQDALDGKIKILTVNTENSRLWYHPGFFFYIINRFFNSKAK